MNIKIKIHLISRGRSLATFAVAALIMPMLSQAHDEVLHIRMTQSAFQSSDGIAALLSEASGSENAPYAYAPILFSKVDAFPSGMKFSPRSWMIHGSYYEDMMTYCLGKQLRCLDHFYTVIPKPVAGLSDWTEPAVGGWLAWIYNIHNAFEWASQQFITGPGSVAWGGCSMGVNTETYQDARAYEFAALTASTKADRDQNLAHMLYTLGHVLHINQDMSQPDHTRNDNHYTKKYIETYGLRNYLLSANAFPTRPHGWLYWRDAGFAKLQDFWDRGLYTGQSSALNADANPTVPGNQRLGLAEFSNGNLLGEDALYTDAISADDVWHHFPYPKLNSTNLRNIQYRLADGLGLQDVFDVTFFKDKSIGNRIYLTKSADGTNINHHSAMGYLGVKSNPRCGAYGNFWNVQAGLTINDSSVLKEYHDAMIPRAIEYSTGILDYFCRAKLDLTVTAGENNYHLHIVNKSGQAFRGGAFELYYDNTSGVRNWVSDGLVTTYPGTLADNESFDFDFTAPSDWVEQFILVYKGTIGVTGSQAIDPVDDGRAIAVKTFKPLCTQIWQQIVVLRSVGKENETVTAAQVQAAVDSALATALNVDFENPPVPWYDWDMFEAGSLQFDCPHIQTITYDVGRTDSNGNDLYFWFPSNNNGGPPGLFWTGAVGIELAVCPNSPDLVAGTGSAIWIGYIARAYVAVYRTRIIGYPSQVCGSTWTGPSTAPTVTACGPKTYLDGIIPCPASCPIILGEETSAENMVWIESCPCPDCTCP